ncbi:hypothetical protein DXG01_001289 [Tephrocybe rancida]|nr:hypothetical protein DXG01_001289 [Tephrocybe rancida]
MTLTRAPQITSCCLITAFYIEYLVSNGEEGEQMAEHSEGDPVVIVLGPTGAGKSTFINNALGNELARVGHGIEPMTLTVTAYVAPHPRHHGQTFLLVDTPGFASSAFSDSDRKVLKRILLWLDNSTLALTPLRRILIIYLLEIDQRLGAETDVRMSPRKLWRSGLSDNLLIVTTKWNNTLTEAKLQREEGLSKAYGVNIRSFLDTQESAWDIIDCVSDNLTRMNITDLRRRLERTLEKSQIKKFFSLLRGKKTHLPIDNMAAGGLSPLISPAMHSKALPQKSTSSHGSDVSIGHISSLSRVSSRSPSGRTGLENILLPSEAEDTTKRMVIALRDPSAYANDIRKHLVPALRKLSSKTGLYPSQLNLVNLHIDDEYPVYSGVFSDIYRGRLHHSGEHRVCIKVIRPYSTSTQGHVFKTIAQQASIWLQLFHPNLLPFYGFYNFRNRPSLVYPWAKNGAVVKYLMENPTASRDSLCLDVARGVEYLHENDILHGDLRGENILVDESGRAYITGFAFSKIVDEDFQHWTSESYAAREGGTVRWQAPELLDPGGNVGNTQASDVYAWASLCYEIFTGCLPFFAIKRDVTIMAKILQGGRPTRPTALQKCRTTNGVNIKDAIWALMEACWHHEPRQRPTISQAISSLVATQLEDRRPPGEWENAPSFVASISMNERDVAFALSRVNHILWSGSPGQEAPTQHVIPSITIIESDDEQETSSPSSLGAESHQQLIALGHRLAVASADPSEYQKILSSTGSEAQALLDTLQAILTSGEIGDDVRRRLVTTVQRLSFNSRLYPRTFRLGGIRDVEGVPITSGGYADIYQGVLQQQRVCLKVSRHLSRLPGEEESIKFGGRVALVSPWAENGNVLKFLKADPNANRVLLCIDVARGLDYLHDSGIVHGDMKGLNILIDASGRAYVGDFGNAAYDDSTSVVHWEHQGSRGGTVRWQAPELFAGEEDATTDGTVNRVGKNTMATDVYAWACVCYEIFTDHPPFFEYPRESAVLLKVTAGIRPSLPDSFETNLERHGLSNQIWNLMNGCWNSQPNQRPTIKQAISLLDAMQLEDLRPAGEWAAGRDRSKDGVETEVPFTMKALRNILSRSSFDVR